MSLTLTNLRLKDLSVLEYIVVFKSKSPEDSLTYRSVQSFLRVRIIRTMTKANNLTDLGESTIIVLVVFNWRAIVVASTQRIISCHRASSLSCVNYSYHQVDLHNEWYHY
jgi:hypothetical protein